jgi:hypothetical protein
MAALGRTPMHEDASPGDLAEAEALRAEMEAGAHHTVHTVRGAA